MNVSINGNELTIGNHSAMLSYRRMLLFKAMSKVSPKVVPAAELMELVVIENKGALARIITRLREDISEFKQIEVINHRGCGYQIKISKGE